MPGLQAAIPAIVVIKKKEWDPQQGYHFLSQQKENINKIQMQLSAGSISRTADDLLVVSSWFQVCPYPLLSIPTSSHSRQSKLAININF